MRITRDIVNDLLPLYLAGEVSQDTRALVEDYLHDNPAFAAEVRAAAEKNAALLGVFSGATTPDQETATLERIKQHNRHRNQFFVFAMVFLLVPFAFVFGEGRISWFMLRDSPKQAVMFFVISALCWVGWAVLGRRTAMP
jgi:anti-sigma factor RsiW